MVNEDWDPDGPAVTGKDEPQAMADAITELAGQWQRAFTADAEGRTKKLLEDAPGAVAGERLLLEGVGQDAAIADQLWRSQVQLTARIIALVDDPKTVLLLAKALQKVTSCRTATNARVEGGLMAANVLRVQRRLGNQAQIRRVA